VLRPVGTDNDAAATAATAATSVSRAGAIVIKKTFVLRFALTAAQRQRPIHPSLAAPRACVCVLLSASYARAPAWSLRVALALA
jgi:hypothetical protein